MYYERVRDALARGDKVQLKVRPVKVGLPPHLLATGTGCWLGWCERAIPPIPDLVVSFWGISGTLNYGGEPFWTHVQWSDVVDMKVVSFHKPHTTSAQFKTAVGIHRPKGPKALPAGWRLYHGQG